jgi:putative transposase
VAIFHVLENHRRKLRTTNLAERLMKEIKRRTKVVEVFPNPKELLRLVRAMLIEQEEQWNSEKRYLPRAPDQPAATVIPPKEYS